MTRARWRLGFVCDGWWPEPGGVQTVTHELADEFTRRGHEVFVLAFGNAAERERESYVDGVHLRREERVQFRPSQLEALTRSAAQEALVARWCADKGLDLVHLHSLSGWGLGVPARLRELRQPVVWTWHDYWPLCPRGQMWHAGGRACERAEAEVCGACVTNTWPELVGANDAEEFVRARHGRLREAVEACARVWCPSEAAREVVLRHGLFDPASIGVCRNGSRAPRASTSQCSRRASADSVRVGVLGSVQPSQGVLELARWIVELGAPFELEVHGPLASYHGDMSYVRALERLAQEEPRIRLHGPFAPDEREAVFAGLDLVAVPSLWEEVHGLVAREARLAGLPVFVSRRGGLEDATFECLAAGDGEAWKRALRRFAEEASWRDELSAPAPSLRTSAQMAEELLAEYAAVIGP